MKKSLKIIAVFLSLLQLTAFVTFAGEKVSPFSDVKTSRWSYDGIMYCYEKGLMNGVGDGKFNPSGKTTRAMITTILYRIALSAGFTEEVKGARSFKDVEKTQWYGPAVTWAKRCGVVNGYEGNVFKPNDNVTREQMAAMMVRMEEYCGYLTDSRADLSKYPDCKKVHDYAADAMAWVNNCEIITGTTSSDGKTVLDPRGFATREQVAAILQRYCEMTHLEYSSPVMKSQFTPAPAAVIVDDADVYVSVSGDDSNDGSLDAPVKTVAKAQEILRGKMQLSGKTGDYVIALKAGVYPENIVINDIDSGDSEHNVRYVSYGDGEVVLGGGITISPDKYEELTDEEKGMFFEENLPHIKKVDLSALTDVSSLPEDMVLFSGDTVLVSARYPNRDEKGDAFLSNPVDPNWQQGVDTDYSKKYLKEYFDIVSDYEISLFGALKERVSSYHSYDTMKISSYLTYDWFNAKPSATYDRSKNILSMNPSESGYPLERIPNGRFFIFNVSDELDKADEYFYDKTTHTLYLCDPSENGCSIASDGNAVTLSNAHNIIIERLTVAGKAGDGIKKTGNLSDFKVLNCTFKNIKGTALNLIADRDWTYARSDKHFLNPCYRVTVQGCEMFNIGNRGIELYGGERETLTSSECLIDNNFFHDIPFDNLYSGGPIWVRGVGITISHNELSNLPHMGIEYDNANDVIIEYNYIHDAKTISSDAGVIYSGRRWSNYGCIIRYNVLADIGLSEKNRNSNGVYFDDELSGQNAYCNLLYNIAGWDFQASGRDNSIKDNIMIHTRGCTGYDAENNVDFSTKQNIRFFEGITHEFTEYAKGSTLTGEALFLDFANNTETERGNMIELWPSLSQFDFRHGIWAEKYPGLAALSTNADDIDSGNFIINNGGCDVSGNIEIGHRIFDISGNLTKFGGKVENNVTYPITSAPYFKDAAHGDYTVIDPSFPQIPFAEIGRY